MPGRRLRGKQSNPDIASPRHVLRGRCKTQGPTKYIRELPAGLSSQERRRWLQKRYESSRATHRRPVRAKPPLKYRASGRAVVHAERIEGESLVKQKHLIGDLHMVKPEIIKQEPEPPLMVWQEADGAAEADDWSSPYIDEILANVDMS